MLDQIVEAIAAKHTGGKEFFDILDANLLDDKVYAAVYGMIKDPQRYSFVLTGTFGQRFLQWMNRCSKPYAGYIVYPGGLRDGKVQQHNYHYFKKPNGWWEKACFVDDSIYSGTTRLTAIHQLSVPQDIETFVAYDGMAVQADWCRSLYRYFDNFDHEWQPPVEPTQPERPTN